MPATHSVQLEYASGCPLSTWLWQGDPPPPSSQDTGGSQQRSPHRQPQQQRQPPQQQDSRGGDMTGSHLGHNVGLLATIDLTVPAPAPLPGCARPPFLFALHPTSHAQQAAQRPMPAQQPQHPIQYYQPPPQHRQQQQQQQQQQQPRQHNQPPPYRQQEQQQPPQQQSQQPQQGRGYWLMRPPATNTGGGSASRSGENHGPSSHGESAPLDWSASSDGGYAASAAIGEAGPASGSSEANEARRPLEASLPLSPYPMPLYQAVNSLNLPPVFLGPQDPLLDYLSVFDQSGDSNGSGSGAGDEDHDRNPSPTDDRVSVSSSLTATSQPQPPSFSSASGQAQPAPGGGGQAHPSQAVFRPWALARQLSGGPPPRPPAFERSSTSSSGHPPMGGFLEPGSRPSGPPLLVRTTSSGYSLSLSLPGRSGSYLSDSGGGAASIGSVGSSMSREDLLAAIPLVPEPMVGPPGAPPVPFRSLSHLLPAAPPPQHPPFFQRAHTAPAYQPSPSYQREMSGYQPLPHPSSLLNVAPGVTLESAWAELEPEKRSEYRRRCVLRWLHKRKRRKADRGVQYSERSLLAHKRHRVSGRFVRQTTTFVAVTALDRSGHAEGASGRETPEGGERQGQGASGGGGGAAASSRAKGRRQRRPARGRGRGRGRDEDEDDEDDDEDSEFEVEEEDESSSDEEYGRRRKGKKKKGR